MKLRYKREVLRIEDFSSSSSSTSISDESQSSSHLNFQAVYCNSSTRCAAKLGVEAFIGPDNTGCISFGYDKVIVHGVQPRKEHGGWAKYEELLHLRGIVVRRDASFYEGLHCITRPAGEFFPLNLNFIAEDYRYEDLIIDGNKIPRREQLIAFVLSLRRNRLISLPTGFGKTLIASLIMHRFLKTNPGRFPVLIVDRVPLAHQQAEAISRDTHLVFYLLVFYLHPKTLA